MHDFYEQEKPPAKAAATQSQWWRGAVIYQIYPRSFQDHNGDGIGDLVGVTQRLEYVADLGVDGIWLSPFFASPMKDFGYDVASYRDVDPLFGTIEDFDRLIEKAHGLGLKVIIDQVISHSSDQHPWFQESRQSRNNPRADWYVWADPAEDGTPPNNWLSIFGGSAWHWDPRRKQYFLHNFLTSQPDLNFHNPQVQDALLAEMRFWLERKVDGFRLDTVNFYFHAQSLRSNPPVAPEDFNASIAPDVNPYNMQDHLFDKSQPENLAFLRRVRTLMNEYPGTTTVGEVGDAQRQLEIMAQYTSGNDKLHMAYTFDFLGGAFDAEHFIKSIRATEKTAPDGWQCLAFSNHDVKRHVSRWCSHGDEDRFARLAAMILMSMRGSVCLYQGEELGLTEADIAFEDIADPYGKEFWPNFKGRDGCRTPMVWQAHAHLGGFTTAPRSWLPVPADHLTRAVDQQEHSNQSSVLGFYRRFIRFRKSQPALITGDITLVEAPDDILAFTRTGKKQSLFCAFNMSGEAAKFDLPAGMKLQTINAPGSVEPTGDQYIELPAFGALIASIRS
ncbi:MAG TPA: alpha-glucosidase [Devosia sp.]|nr:alpha-glucosidase [Devosia sp.]